MSVGFGKQWENISGTDQVKSLNLFGGEEMNNTFGGFSPHYYECVIHPRGSALLFSVRVSVFKDM